MLIDFEDKDYNTLILTFDKNSDIDTFESNIKEAEELGFKYLFRIFVTYGNYRPIDYESKLSDLILGVDKLIETSSLMDLPYYASGLGEFYPEAYVAVAEEIEGCTIAPVRMASAIPMREFKNKKNVKQNVKK